VGVTAHTVSDKEVEIGACVGLSDMLYIEALPTAHGIGKAGKGGGVGSAAQQLLL
jgi:hypothetical protein